ncbi:MAG: GNAT family N-acetyltransferase [Mariprofundaceae bacterium]
MSEGLHPSGWDTAVFGMPCFDITDYNHAVLAHAAATPGHYSIKVAPLADKALLHRYGFYYTDTLVEPACTAERLIAHPHPQANIDPDVALQALLPMCRQTFVHGRFHRDFNLPAEASDRRYMQWLEQMHREDTVLGLNFEGELAGFIAVRNGALLLHAVAASFRGRGLAKYMWTAACRYLFTQGAIELSSSVSAANLPVLNLYASLGFRFRAAVDVYHRLSV